MPRYCSQCHSKLWEKGSPCVALWEAICQVYEEGERPFTVTSKHKCIEILNYLEREGYVFSTEHRSSDYPLFDFIFIKPNRFADVFRGIDCNHQLECYE